MTAQRNAVPTVAVHVLALLDGQPQRARGDPRIDLRPGPRHPRAATGRAGQRIELGEGRPRSVTADEFQARQAEQLLLSGIVEQVEQQLDPGRARAVGLRQTGAYGGELAAEQQVRPLLGTRHDGLPRRGRQRRRRADGWPEKLEVQPPDRRARGQRVGRKVVSGDQRGAQHRPATVELVLPAGAALAVAQPLHRVGQLHVQVAGAQPQCSPGSTPASGIDQTKTSGTP